MRIARVFPRRTRATPADALAFVGDPPLFLPQVDDRRPHIPTAWKGLVRRWVRPACIFARPEIAPAECLTGALEGT